MLHRLAIPLLLAVAAAGGCSRASNEGEAKKWQDTPPPKEVAIPTGLSIAVSVDGADQPPITSKSLEGIKPDYVDTEHRAWRIGTIVPAASSGSTVEASASNGVSVKFASPTPEGLEPALLLTRRGEVIVGAVDPKDPFPRYHGQGSRLKRPGDTMPRVAPVTKLAITHAAP